MKKNNRYMILASILAVLISAVSITGCYAPSPLYGTWMNNSGDTVRFHEDYTFSANIKTPSGPVSYEGTYIVQDNVLVFEVENPSFNIITEWDIRGAMFYCTWITSDDQQKKLTLYRVSR